MKEVPCMYRLKPICGLHARVELPKCMYKLRQIQGSIDSTDVMHENILAKSAVIEEQENHPIVKTLEQRQEAILGQLRNLKRLVEELSRQLKVAPSSPPKATYTCLNTELQEDGKCLQVVVKANPRRMPHALLSAIRIWCSPESDSKLTIPGSLEVKWYCHSTIDRTGPSFPWCVNNKNTPRVRLTVIWKDAVPGDLEFSIGSSSSRLRSEALLLSLLMSYLPSNIKVRSADVITEVAISALLDCCTVASNMTTSISSPKLKKNLMELWNAASFPGVMNFSAHSFSLSEIVLWGTLKSIIEQTNKESLPAETPEELSAWFLSYSKFLGL